MNLSNLNFHAQNVAASYEKLQLTKIWIKLIFLNKYIRILQPIFKFKCNIHTNLSYVVLYARKIKNMFLKWYYRHIFLKYTMRFRKMLQKNRLYFIIQMRIHRKRRALSKIRVFLKEHRGHHKVKIICNYLLFILGLCFFLYLVVYCIYIIRFSY